MSISRTKADNAPDAITIKNTRTALGITQREASIYAKSTLRSWQQWEQGHRLMHPAIWSYFLITTAHIASKPRIPSNIGDFDYGDIRSTLKSVWETTQNLETVRSCLANFYQSHGVDPSLARWSVVASMVSAGRTQPTPDEMAAAVQEIASQHGKDTRDAAMWLSHLA